MTPLERAFEQIIAAAFLQRMRDTMLDSLVEMTVAQMVAMTPEQLHAKADEALLHSRMMGNA
jgi:hypothetical protein